MCHRGRKMSRTCSRLPIGKSFFMLPIDIYGQHIVASLVFLTYFRHTFVAVSHSAFNTLPISSIFGMQVPFMDLYLLMRFEVTGVKVTEAYNRFSVTFVTVSHSAFNILPISYIFGM